MAQMTFKRTQTVTVYIPDVIHDSDKRIINWWANESKDGVKALVENDKYSFSVHLSSGNLSKFMPRVIIQETPWIEVKEEE